MTNKTRYTAKSATNYLVLLGRGTYGHPSTENEVQWIFTFAKTLE